MSDHLVPGAPWAPSEWDTLECMTALIHFATVHNAGYVYRLQCTIEGSDLGLGIYGANVVYTITAAKG